MSRVKVLKIDPSKSLIYPIKYNVVPSPIKVYESNNLFAI